MCLQSTFLVVSLTTELGIESDLLIAAMRDYASVNNVAIRTLSIVFPKVLDIGCFSHNIDHVREHMKIPVLEEFLKGWIGLVSRNPKAILAWNSLTGMHLFLAIQIHVGGQSGR